MQRFKKDWEKLKARAEKGQAKEAKRIYQAIGRLQERYSRVGRYCRMDYGAEQKALTRQEEREKEVVHRGIYSTLKMPTEAMKPVSSWHALSIVTE